MSSVLELHRSKEEDLQLDQLLAGIAGGDRDALEELYHRTSTAIYAFALSLLKNPHDAEDVLQDSYLQIYGAAEGYRSQGKPMAWIMTIVRNLSMMRLRQQKKITALPEEDWSLALSESYAMNTDERLLLAWCMEALSPQDRQIVVLHAVAGFKHRQIAELLDLGLATVLSKYHRSIKKLKELYERSVTV